MVLYLDTVFFQKTQRMDDQNQQNPQAGGAQPVNDTNLPWMNFAPDGSTGGDNGQSSGGAGASDPTADTNAASGTFDPFGNPFAAGNDSDVAAAFAPSTSDGSMQQPETTAPFIPSEETAFTPVAQPVDNTASTPLPWENTSNEDASANSSGEDAYAGQDTMSLLSTLKERFDEEEEDFNREIEEHNANIRFEKEAINNLRAERSARLSEMRDVVRGLQDMLGLKSSNGSSAPEKEKRQDKPRHHETRRAEKGPQKKTEKSKGAESFLDA